MTDFKDTSNWEKKSNSSILYRYEYQGKPHEGELEKEPHVLHVAIEQLSLNDRTAWEFADEKRSDSVTGYLSGEYIRATGKLNQSRVHAFLIGEATTVSFNHIDVSIYPTTLEDLQGTSLHERWGLHDNDERPEDGWLKDERGRIDFYEASEYMVEPALSARLWLDQENFNALVHKIKNGSTIQTARLEILADLFQFGYEGAFSSPMDTSNYGLLCDKEGRAHTKARLEEILLEWSPTLAKPKPDDGTFDDWPLDDDLPPDAPADDVVSHAVNRMASDVKDIRSRVNTFYQASIFAILILVLSRVLDWFGM